MSSLQDRLLDAHVQHELARWQGDTRSAGLSAFTSELFRWFSRVKLDDVANVAEIMGVIDRYVIELRVSGGITELLGEASQIVFSSPTAATPLKDLLDDKSYEAFSEKIAALDTVRNQLIATIVRSEAFELVSARVLARALGDLLLGGPAVDKLKKRVLPRFEGWIAQKLVRYHERQGAEKLEHRAQRALAAIDDESFRSLADELWASVASLPLSEVFTLIGRRDLEDFVVLGYEFWQRYRKTDYFRSVAEEITRHFFDKYGQQSLSFLIEDMGVSEQMVAQELDVVLSPLVAEAARSGFLEQQIRARLAPFYGSLACSEILAL